MRKDTWGWLGGCLEEVEFQAPGKISISTKNRQGLLLSQAGAQKFLGVRGRDTMDTTPYVEPSTMLQRLWKGWSVADPKSNYNLSWSVFNPLNSHSVS